MKLFWQLPTALRESLARLVLQNNSRHALKDEDAVGLLEDKTDTPGSPKRPRLLNTRTRWTYWLTGIFGFLLVLVALALPSKALKSKLDTSPASTDIMTEHRKLHIVLPTSVVSLDLCKAVLSGAVLGYPTPWLIGWEKDQTDIERLAHEGSLSKLKTIEQWLNQLPQAGNTDIVAYLGNHKATFQARPEVLLKRYYQNRAAGDEQLKLTFAPDLLELQNMYSKIIFSTEKECASSQPTKTKCEQFTAEDGSIHYLSSNLIMGQLGMMRALWNAAVRHADALTTRNQPFDENSIFSDILRGQERQRKTVLKYNDGTNHTKPIGDKAREFGINLDFSRELGYATASTFKHGDWIKHKGSKAAPVPKDIADSMSPFWTTTGTGVPSDRTWEDVSLFTHASTNIVPAIIQQGPKTSEHLTKIWWKKLWFHPYARQLLDSFALTPSVPVATLRNETGEVRWWGPHWEKVGVMTSDLTFHEWQDFCGSEKDAEIFFQDEGGVWKDPRLESTGYFPQGS